MTLEQKLKSINEPKLGILPTGSSKTIEDFWNDFIEPMLPDPKMVLEMHRLLMRYVDDPEAVFAVRAFGSWSAGDVENVKGDELRRGFLTIPSNASYQYFFTDKYFAAYFAKMVYDGYCPSYKEFKDAMLSRVFPARFGPNCKLERDKKVYAINGKDPGISKAGYKIAHIVDAGNRYAIGNYSDGGIKALSDAYVFPRGKYSQWEKELLGGKELYVRRLDVTSDTLAVLKAHFLRFVDPLNYILVPKAKYKDRYYNVFTNNLKNDVDHDVAEYKPLLDFVSAKYTNLFGNEYGEYLNSILLPKGFIGNPNGAEVIDIHYGFMCTSAAPSPSPKPKAQKKAKRPGNVVLVPEDIDEFKQALLINRKATVILEYQDGKTQIKEWDAKKFTASSDVMQNILTRSDWKSRAKTGIVAMRIEVL